MSILHIVNTIYDKYMKTDIKLQNYKIVFVSLLMLTPTGSPATKKQTPASWALSEKTDHL